MDVSPNEDLVREIEASATDMARQAGSILQSYFRRPLKVEYKGEKGQDPVTPADTESQAYLRRAITRSFPDHGIVGEEDGDDVDGAAADFLWILDPLDGTTNFLNGLPIYAVSIGVVYRGMPVAGALFIPWPGDGSGSVLHARKGGGAWVGEEPISIPQAESPEHGRLSAVPGSLGGRFRVRRELRRRFGEVRMAGSIAYEMALTAYGAFQYLVIGGPKLWDIAAGALIVKEAGGSVLTRSRGTRGWHPLVTIGPSWEGGSPNLKEFRNSMGPLIVGSDQVAAFVAANLQRRNPVSARIARLMARLRHRSTAHKAT